jgi:hypothetical protein
MPWQPTLTGFLNGSSHRRRSAAAQPVRDWTNPSATPACEGTTTRLHDSGAHASDVADSKPGLASAQCAGGDRALSPVGLTSAGEVVANVASVTRHADLPSGGVTAVAMTVGDYTNSRGAGDAHALAVTVEVDAVAAGNGGAAAAVIDEGNDAVVSLQDFGRGTSGENGTRTDHTHRTATLTEHHEWECGACTFVNTHADAPVCEVCRTERDPTTVLPIGKQTRGSPHSTDTTTDTDIEVMSGASGRPEHCDDVVGGGETGGPSADKQQATPPVGHSDGKRRRVIGAFGGTLLPSAPAALFAPPRDGAIQPTPNTNVDGLFIVHDFIDEATEAALVAWINTSNDDSSNPWRRSRFNGKHMVKTWGVRTDLWTGTVRLPTDSEPKFPPPGGEMNAVIDNLRRIDFGRLARTANGWYAAHTLLNTHALVAVATHTAPLCESHTNAPMHVPPLATITPPPHPPTPNSMTFSVCDPRQNLWPLRRHCSTKYARL